MAAAGFPFPNSRDDGSSSVHSRHIGRRLTCGTFVHRGVPTFVRRSCPLSVSCMVHGRSRRGGAQDPRRRFRHARVVHGRSRRGAQDGGFVTLRSCTTGRSRAWCPRRRRAPSSFTMPGDDGRLEPRSNERANAARAHSNPTGLEHFISESGPFLAEPARSSL